MRFADPTVAGASIDENHVSISPLPSVTAAQPTTSVTNNIGCEGSVSVSLTPSVTAAHGVLSANATVPGYPPAYATVFSSEHLDFGHIAAQIAPDSLVSGGRQDQTPKISIESAELIESKFTETEVLEAVKECDCAKAPGPDGFKFKFFKVHWDLIKGDLMNALHWFWDKCEISKGCNASFITLVPKNNDPLGLNEYRPISLIGCYYKILAKILSIRIRKVLPAVIGYEQSAYLKGRFILDGSLIANEAIEYLKRKRKKSLIFKFDFEKAFDSLSWDFLLDMMSRMGFGSRWRRWILACLKSASISILVNGSPTNEFLIERGVRQGDPLSPFLFLIAAEGLNFLVKKVCGVGLFRGVEIGKDKVKLSHLQFADDTIFVGEWHNQNFCNLMKVLKCFENLSGLKVNFHKSVLYGLGVACGDVERLATRVGCKVGELPFIYLGLPVGKNMSLEHNWKPVIDKFNSKLSSWKARSISYGGRLTLVKSVLRTGENTKIPWVKWDECLLPDDEGGLNIGSLRGKNLALLGKWFWRAKTEPNSLWVSVIKSIYGYNELLPPTCSSGSIGGSSVWSNISLAGIMIEKMDIEFASSFLKAIGDGADTLFWEDPWIGGTPLKHRFSRLFHLDEDSSAKVIDRVTWIDRCIVYNFRWHRDVSGRTRNDLESLVELLNVYVKQDKTTNSWIWNLAGNGIFTTKKMAKFVDEKFLNIGSNGRNDEFLKNGLVPNKVALFIRRALKRRIPVRTELDKRGMDLDSVRCPLCDDDVETVEHALIFCRHAMDIWVGVFKWWGLGAVSNLSISEIFRGKCNRSLSPQWSSIWQSIEWTCGYLIWKNRNQKVFSNSSWSGPSGLMEIQLKSFEWVSNRIKNRILDWLGWISDPWSCLV
ncbi:uncharacterized protein [Rutidosis leptorrhynchoides]|uniref:uncharacterized protein n=1 Tax=Rutidosis leptorrhynchoides TaxID=125765 RepID=UPI003A992741